MTRSEVKSLVKDIIKIKDAHTESKSSITSKMLKSNLSMSGLNATANLDQEDGPQIKLIGVTRLERQFYEKQQSKKQAESSQGTPKLISPDVEYQVNKRRSAQVIPDTGETPCFQESKKKPKREYLTKPATPVLREIIASASLKALAIRPIPQSPNPRTNNKVKNYSESALRLSQANDKSTIQIKDRRVLLSNSVKSLSKPGSVSSISELPQKKRSNFDFRSMPTSPKKSRPQFDPHLHDVIQVHNT